MATQTSTASALDSWNANADFWDEGVGLEGNKYWKVLQRPCLERLIEFNPGCKAMELACGNGLVSRWLAGQGAAVLATDGSDKMLEHAKQRTCDKLQDRIAYSRLDVTQAGDFEVVAKSASETGGFDIVLINMAIMDIPTLEPLAKALPLLMKKGGVFVATMLHPIFFTCGATRKVEIAESLTTKGPEVIRTHSIRDYLHVPPWRGVAVYGQPELQLYFHRPLHELFAVFFEAGLVMDALEEPAFTEADKIANRVEARSNYTQIPPILAFRFRKI